MPPPNFSPFSQRRKLPAEHELRDYLDSFISSGPGDLDSYFLNQGMSNGFPALIYQDLSLTPQPLEPTGPAADFVIPEFVPDAMRAQMNRATSKSILNENYLFNMAGYMDRIIREVHAFYDRMRILQIGLLCVELDTKGYVAYRTHEELKAEIVLRRKQYPREPLYVLTGALLTDYYNTLYGSSLDEAEIVCLGSDYMGGYRYDKPFDQYKTAVIAHTQIKANHATDMVYHIERVPRNWQIHIVMQHRFALQVPKRLVDPKIIKDKRNIRFDLEM